MSDMFGSPIGESAYDADLMNTLKGGVSVQHTLGQIAMQPAEGRLKQAQADEAELKLQNQKKMQELMMRAQAPGAEGKGPAGGMVGQFDSLAEMAAGSGLFGEAQKLALTAATLRQRGAAAIASANKATLDGIKTVAEQAKVTGQIFGGATDEKSWKAANDLYEFRTGQPSPYKNSPYSQELVDSINEQALTVQQRVVEEERSMTRQNTERYRSERIRQHDVENKIRQIRSDLAAQREERLAKAGGGKAVSSPATAEVNQAANMIKRDFENMDVADRKDAAFAIASEAKALRRANPALDASTALIQAYQNAKNAGDFQVQERLGGLRADLQKYNSGGKTPEAALPMPKSAGEAVKGRYYRNAKGTVAKWNGSKFEVVEPSASRRPLSGNNGRPIAAPDTSDTSDDSSDDTEEEE